MFLITSSRYYRDVWIKVDGIGGKKQKCDSLSTNKINEAIYTAFEYQAINCNIYQLIVHLNIIIVSLYIDVHVFVTV